MKNNLKAIFLGKFQPPHLGHIRTILRIAKSYKKVIIGITKEKSKILEYDEIKNIFDEVFEQYQNISTEIIEGTIESETSDLSKYDFDIILSGNKKVISLLNKKRYKTEFYPRIEGLGYSGSELRAILNKQLNNSHNNKNLFEFKLFPMNNIKPLEKILATHFKNIEQMILKDNIIFRPLIIDNKYNIVLDGSHRYAFLQKHGYRYAPCLLVDYEDESIFVGNHLKHRFIKDENFTISKTHVIFSALNEKLLNARATRHFFPFRKENHETSLDILEKGSVRDISYLFEDISKDDEILIDKKYLQELNEEMNILENYIKEQKDVKKYLETQLNMMQN